MSTPKSPTILTLPNVRLKDERTVFFLDFIRWMTYWKLNSHVEQVYIQNMREVQELANETGVIIAPNHVSYWDSCLFFTLSEHISKRAFVFVAQSILERFPFLRWCGAIPLNTTSSIQAIAQLKQTHRLFTKPTQFWIFPQGKHRPPHLQPLRFKQEVTTLAHHLELPVVPVAIQYLYRDSQKPVAYVSFRPPLPHHCSVHDIEGEIKRGLIEIDQFHLGKKNDRFISLYERSTTNKENLTTRLLAWFSSWKLGKL